MQNPLADLLEALYDAITPEAVISAVETAAAETGAISDALQELLAALDERLSAFNALRDGDAVVAADAFLNSLKDEVEDFVFDHQAL